MYNTYSRIHLKRDTFEESIQTWSMTLMETWTEFDLGGEPESVAFTVKFNHST